MIAYYGSTVKFDTWDITKTKEFGYHFGLEKPGSSLHRIFQSGGFLYEVDLSWKNAITMQDPFFWDLLAILAQLGQLTDYDRLKKLAAGQARINKNSLRTQSNIIAAKILDDMNYDAILYESSGEEGGRCVIIWHPEQICLQSIKEIPPTI